jgi:UDP-N-acetylmuramate dehydrogenase
MLNIQNDIDLSKLSTMRVGGVAKYYFGLDSIDQLEELRDYIKNNSLKHIVIGEGSNTLFSGDFEGIVIKNMIKGKKTIDDSDNFIKIECGAGENWHTFIEYCVNMNFAGNENLAFIPGTIGAAPVQNIAAYGQAQEDTFISLTAYNFETGEFRVFDRPECEFKYRYSIFKAESYKDKYIITSVTYQLKKAAEYIPELNYHSRYESLKPILEAEKKDRYTLIDVFNAIIKIRKSKLPDPSEIGTLGSFFLNPFISKQKLEEVQKKFPGIQFYPVDKMQYPGLDEINLKDIELVKIPAGWILEELGWKGNFEDQVGCSEKHALCIVVKGASTGKKVVEYAEQVKASVYKATGIELKSEVNII